jgi:hypothetical protein
VNQYTRDKKPPLASGEGTTYFGGGGDGPRLVDRARGSLSTSRSLMTGASAYERRFSLTMWERLGSCDSPLPTLNWMDRRRGLSLRGLASKEILRRWAESAGVFKLCLDSGLSSDSKEGLGELWTDIVAMAGLTTEVLRVREAYAGEGLFLQRPHATATAGLVFLPQMSIRSKCCLGR